MLEISKDRSALIKGVAIVMMLIFHLFGGSMTDLCTNLLHVANEPFARWLSHACGPVPFFLIVSGYGLAYKYDQGTLKVKGQLRSALRIYLHFWLVLLLFLPLGAWLQPDRYPRGLHKIVLNALGWYTTYYHEMWFLFPYVCVSLMSPYILRLISRIGTAWSLVLMAALHLTTSFLLSDHGASIIGQLPWSGLYKLILVFHILFYFTVGVALRRTTWTWRWQVPQWVLAASIIILIIAGATAPSSLRYMLYAPLLTILLCKVHFAHWLETMLVELGRKSMTIWMIHPWIALYLFKPQIYSLHYPILIFIAVLAASYLLSVIIMWLATRITTLFTPSTQG